MSILNVTKINNNGLLGMLSRLNVGMRLSLSVLFPIIVLIVVVISAVNIFSKIEQGVASIYNDRVVPLQDLKIIADDYAVLVIDAINKANSGRKTAEEALKDVRLAKQQIRSKWDAYMATSLTKEEAQLADEAKALFSAADLAINNVEQTLSQLSGNVRGQLDAIDGPLYDQVDPISDKLAELIALQLRVAGEERDRIGIMTESLTYSYIIGTLIAAFLVIALSFLVRKSIVGPLNKLQAAMSTIEKTSDISITIDLHSNDEIGQTALVFNQMMKRINDVMAQIKNAITQMSTASEELSTIAIQTSKSTQKQQADTDQVATAIHQMSTTVQQVAHSTSEAQQAAQSADTQTSDGREVASRSASLISELMDEIQNTSSSIESLENESQNIGSVVDTINGIAEQTNLLALNAAIEAARAGEQGRGFAVVADEVRTLAQRTQQSTQEIRDVVERLQQGAHNAVNAMSSGKEKAEECSATVQQTHSALVQIEQAVQNIRDMNIQIASAVEEQSAVTEDINVNVSSINSLSIEAASASFNISESGQHLAKLAVEISGQVNQFKISD